MSETPLYDNPAFIQPSLWSGETRFYKFDNNLGASLFVSGASLVLQAIRFPGGHDNWQITSLRGIPSGPVHTVGEVERYLKEIDKFPWGA